MDCGGTNQVTQLLVSLLISLTKHQYPSPNNRICGASIIATVLYALIAGIPVQQISPSFFGIAGTHRFLFTERSYLSSFHSYRGSC